MTAAAGVVRSICEVRGKSERARQQKITIKVVAQFAVYSQLHFTSACVCVCAFSMFIAIFI